MSFADGVGSYDISGSATCPTQIDATQLALDSPALVFQQGIVESEEEERPWASLVSISSEEPTRDLYSIPEGLEEQVFNLHTLGRATKHCNILIDKVSKRISNVHCRIYCKPSTLDHTRVQAWIEDTSNNGTYVNRSTRLTKGVPRKLNDRDEISLVAPTCPKPCDAAAHAEELKRASFIFRMLHPRAALSEELTEGDNAPTSCFFVRLGEKGDAPKFKGIGKGTENDRASVANQISGNEHEIATSGVNVVGHKVSDGDGSRISSISSSSISSSSGGSRGGHSAAPSSSAHSGTRLMRVSTVHRMVGEERQLQDFYDMGARLGSGGEASVFKAVEKETGEFWAVKITDLRRFAVNSGKRNNIPAGILKEAEIVRKLKHPNIVQLKDVFMTADKLYLVMELCRGGDLLDKILFKKEQYERAIQHQRFLGEPILPGVSDGYTEAEGRTVMKQLVDATSYMHAQNIAHRDLKPENIVLKSKDSDTHVKVTDFGMSKVIDSSKGTRTFCGTNHYIAPEVLKVRMSAGGDGSDALEARYSLQADMWSIGVIMYVLLSSTFPFDDGRGNADSRLILCGNYRFQDVVWGGISSNAKHLLGRMLDVDPDTRITASEALKHPWLNEVPRGGIAATKPGEHTGGKREVCSARGRSGSITSKLGGGSHDVGTKRVRLELLSEEDHTR